MVGSAFALGLYRANHRKKARVIAMTDGEIDDHSSIIRFLLYTCNIELLAIIETNAVYQKILLRINWNLRCQTIRKPVLFT